ncbi:2071_t:CDS:1, partial [Racocetra persica]
TDIFGYCPMSTSAHVSKLTNCYRTLSKINGEYRTSGEYCPPDIV